MKKRLTKSRNKILAGVFGGIAEYFDIDPAWVRIIGAAVIIFTGFFPGTLLYLIAALVMPDPTGRTNSIDADFKKNQTKKEALT